MLSLLPNAARSYLRRTARSALKRGVCYAQNSLQFRRIVLRVLNRIPSLSIKLRKMYIETQLVTSSEVWGWSGSRGPIPAGQSGTYSDDDVNCSSTTTVYDGVNSRQRTPLEEYFLSYTVRR